MQGLLLLNKPEGITSFGSVARIRRMAGEKRVGHTGTLDPMATGVLPIFLGRATSLCSLMLETDKTYTGMVKTGIVTDTCDITGNVIKTSDVAVTQEGIEAVLKQFTGKIRQKPPMYSAIKKDGVRLYELARKGISIDVPEREVNIYSLDIISPLENGSFGFRAVVSKGTYIRSLCRDIGEALGCGATLSSLCRTAVSGFDISQCVSLEDLTPENISDSIIGEENAVKHLKCVNITQNQAIRFTNGGQLDLVRIRSEDLHHDELVRVKYAELFLGIGRVDTQRGLLAIKCIINNL